MLSQPSKSSFRQHGVSVSTIINGELSNAANRLREEPPAYGGAIPSPASGCQRMADQIAYEIHLRLVDMCGAQSSAEIALLQKQCSDRIQEHVHRCELERKTSNNTPFKP